MKVNTKVVGTSIDLFPDMAEFTLCQSYCTNTPGCYHWSWNTKGECSLVGEDGVEEEMENYISGNNFC